MSAARGRPLHKARAVVFVAVVMSLFAASPALAFHSFTIPAGQSGCGFAIHVESEHIKNDRIGYGDITLTNLETGATYLQRSRYRFTETYNAATRSLNVTISGRYWLSLFRGDQGPMVWSPRAASICCSTGLWRSPSRGAAP